MASNSSYRVGQWVAVRHGRTDNCILNHAWKVRIGFDLSGHGSMGASDPAENKARMRDVVKVVRVNGNNTWLANDDPRIVHLAREHMIEVRRLNPEAVKRTGIHEYYSEAEVRPAWWWEVARFKIRLWSMKPRCPACGGGTRPDFIRRMARYI